ADTGYVFHGWSGDSRSLQNPLTLPVERPISLVAEFAVDSDKDGLPDSWELRYLKSLDFTGDQNSDKDNFTNQEELNRGSHPGFAEVVTLEGGFPSRWEDVKRDPSQSGLWQVLDFGNGFRGVSENTNDHRGADLSGGPAPLIPVEEIVPSVTFDGPRLIISQNQWNNSWVDYTIEATISIGDNDGSNVFVRYIDENNWIRVNMEGEDPPAGWRPPTSLSVQKRVNGIYSELATDDSFIFDPADSIGFKRYRVTVAAQGQDYEVRVVGFDTLQDPPIFNPDTEVVINFSDDSLAGGRAGIGSWGQSGSSPTALNPVGTGVFFEDFTVTVGNTIVFSETFDQSLLNNQLPEGWENPFASLTSGQQGDWKSTPHGLVQLSNYFGNSTGTLIQQKADVEGPILLAKPHGSQNFLLEMTIQAFDDDGIGFVYDYIDENNYARVLLRNEKPAVDNSLPQGINISRKSNGRWNDIIVNDTSFIYQLGQPFVIHFPAIGQDHFIQIRQMDNPDKNTTLRWEDQLLKEQSRTGLHTWGMTEGHFWTYTISSLPSESSSEPLRISQVTLNAGQISLIVENGNATYSVEFSEFINATSWQTIASGQTSSIWIGNLPNNGSVGFWRIRRE
ncbi:MAG: hypothetical protein LR011_13815, partial [Verrucomicrobia bacterium]|nr:hypothetical protein [Verrucomicrobiota bacterium]